MAMESNGPYRAPLRVADGPLWSAMQENAPEHKVLRGGAGRTHTQQAVIREHKEQDYPHKGVAHNQPARTTRWTTSCPGGSYSPQTTEKIAHGSALENSL